MKCCNIQTIYYILLFYKKFNAATHSTVAAVVCFTLTLTSVSWNAFV